MNFTKYKDILEFIPKYGNIEFKEEKLYLTIYNFLKERNIKKILISLSGGVDSMVIANILSQIDNIKLVCCHINYNNREESIYERNFLIDYCNYKNLKLEYIDCDVKRGDIKRNLYENETKELRYDFYKKLCKKYNLDGVILGHHLDDYCENVFNNIMRGGREITDLSVFKMENIILDVRILRPLLNVYKNDIYEFSNKFNIPYFLDTTPSWSCRGKMRNNIFPECENCYGNNYKKNLIRIGKESEDLSEIIDKYLIEDLWKKVIFSNDGIIIIKDNMLKEKYIFRILIKKICHKANIPNLKLKIINLIIENFDNIIKFNLSENSYIQIDKSYIKLFLI